MTIDLWILVAAAGLQWLLIMAAAGPGLLRNGLAWGAGNRDTPGATLPPLVQRLQRASDNLKENLVLFAILVVVVHVAGRSGGRSALGAEVFLAARLVHALVYIAGIPYLRTLAWVVSIVGMAMVGTALL